MHDDAEAARFDTFIQSTDQHARDRIAFAEFHSTIHAATMCAVMINPYDSSEQGSREFSEMQRVIGEMLFRVLPRVDLATLIGNAEGIGYAIRYGIIEPRREALDGIKTVDDFTAFAERGYAADQADTDRRLAELEPRESRR